MTTRQLADLFNVRERTMQQACQEGQIPGAHHVGRRWVIPTTPDVLVATQRLVDTFRRGSRLRRRPL